MELRRYRPEDLEALARLFADTVRYVNSRDYSPDQIHAWVAGKDKLKNRDFLSLYTMVATDKGKIVGYGNMDVIGYLDHLYVHKDAQGQGVATAICEELERWIRARGVNRVRVCASITARPFFEKRGYRVEREQRVERNGVWLINYAMVREWEE